LLNDTVGLLPKMNLNGAGLATLIARIIELLLPTYYVFIVLRKKSLVINFKKIKLSLKYFSKMIKICVPSGAQLTLEVGFLSVLNIMAGWLGVFPQAAHAISINILQTIFVFPLAIAVSSSIIVGHFMGKNQISMIRKTGIVSYILALTFFLINITIMCLYNKQIISWYNASPQVTSLVRIIVPVIIMLQIVDGINIIGVNILRGMQDTLIPVIITSLSHWGIGFPLSYILAFKFNLKLSGIWWGAVISFSISSLLVYIRFIHNTTTKEKIKTI